MQCIPTSNCHIVTAGSSDSVWLQTSDGRFGKKEKENDLIRFSATNESIRFDSLLCQNLSLQSTPGVLDSGPDAAGPVHRSHDRPAHVATELLIAFAEASGDTDANVSHDATLQHSDARS